MNIRLPLRHMVAAAACAVGLSFFVNAHATQGVSVANLTRFGLPVTSPLFASAGETYNFDVMLTANGAGNPPGTNGLGLCLEYERAIAGDPTVQHVLTTDLAADGGAQALSGCTQGGATNVPGADFSVIKGWIHIGSGGWPNVALPVRLFDAQFTLAANPVGATRIGFGAASVSAGETFVAPPPIVLCGRPTVALVKTADGSETGPTPATFSVTLSTAVPSVCAVGGVFPITLDIGGSAAAPGQPNADYAFSGANVVQAGTSLTLNFPANGATKAATITVMPVDDVLAEGAETVTLQLASGSGNYLVGAQSLASATIADNDVSSLAIVNGALPNGAIGSPYAQTFTVNGGTSPYTFTISGGVAPPGLTLAASGDFSGTPTSAGVYDFAVGVTDSTAPGAGGPKSDSKAFRVTVDKGTQTITFAPTADRVLYSAPVTVSATNSSSLPVSFSVTGQCSLSGTTVTATGVGTCTVRASQGGNANWNAAANVDRTFNITAPTVAIAPSSVPNAIVGGSYPSTTLSASGGLASYAFTVTAGALPPGLQLGPNGALTGSPTQTGSFTFTVKATDSSTVAAGGPFSATQAYAIDISKSSSTTTLASSANPSANGQTFVLTATVAGGSVAPTGTVTFLDIATPICSSVALQAGKATCTVSGASVGFHSMSANYSGDLNYAPSTAPTLFQNVQNAPGFTVQVAKAGAGSGTVTSAPAGIDCGATCSQPYATGSTLALGASPAPGSMFLGWLGPCGGAGACNLTVNSALTITATFAPDTIAINADIDGNGHYDALTDGVLLIRWLFGLNGQSLISGAVGSGATRTTSAQVIARLDELKPVFDIDADGRVDALSDGVLLIRYLFGLRGNALIAGAIGSTATRTTAPQIEAYIQSLLP